MTVLVGPSGTQKTTATDIGVKNFFRRLEGQHTIMDKISPEKILKRLANLGVDTSSGKPVPRDSVALLYADELSVLLNRAAHADPMSDIIIKLYNAQDRQEYDTIGGGLTVLRNVCVTILATTTPVGLGESVSSKSHSTGYMARVHHVYSERSSKVNPLTDLDDADVDPAQIAVAKRLEESLFERLKEIQQIVGAAHFTRAGKKWYDDWYGDWRRSAESMQDGWPSRRHDHLLRIAMLLRVSAFRDLEIDEYALSAAHKALCEIEADFPKAFQYIGQSAHAKLQEKILSVISANGGRITGATLYSRVRRYVNSIADLKDALQVLGDSKAIDRVVEGNVDYFTLGRNL